MKLKKYQDLIYSLVIVAVAILAWYKVLSFWFFRGWETSWFWGVTGGRFTLKNLLRSHGFVYLLNYKLFGWNPAGWYLTALIFHILASFLVFKTIARLTKDKILAFIGALIFVANVAYNDVVTWGSFEGLYALLLLGFLLVINLFISYRERRKIKYYLLALIIFGILLLIRESSIMAPAFLLGFDLIFSLKKRKKKEIFALVKPHLPFFLLVGLYLIFRSTYGGAPHDYIDAMVQLRIRLLKEGRYLEYLARGFLLFGKFTLAHPIPYPFLNHIRAFILHYFDLRAIKLYFFPIFGWLYTFILLTILWRVRSQKKLFKLLSFALLFFFIPTLFFSFAWAVTDDVLAKDYVWNWTRWWYFAFFGTVLFFTCFFNDLYQKAKRKFKGKKEIITRMAVLGVILVVATNVYLLHQIENEMLEKDHKPARLFYQTFLANFPKLPEDYVFYLYPHAFRLNDYLAEWYFLRQEFYPNLSQPRTDWSEVQIERVLEKFANGKLEPENVFFLDYEGGIGVKNQTEKVREIVRNQGEISFPPRRFASGSKILLSLKDLPPVEFPYQIEIKMSVLPAKQRLLPSAKTGDLKLSRLKALVDYLIERKKIHDRAEVSVCATVGQRKGEPFLHLVKEHLIDNRLGPRSLWVADCRPAWVMLDLKEEKEIQAFSFGGMIDSPTLPSNYSYFTSLDKDSWQEVKRVRGNRKRARIDVLENPIRARFVKMLIETTTGGALLTLDEFEVITKKGGAVLRFYQDRDKLWEDSFNPFSLVKTQEELDYLLSPEIGFSWGKISWQTEPANNVPQEVTSFYFPFYTDGRLHQYLLEIPEGEMYSASGQFLKRFIKAIKIDFGNYPATFEVESIKLQPKYKINLEG